MIHTEFHYESTPLVHSITTWFSSNIPSSLGGMLAGRAIGGFIGIPARIVATYLGVSTHLAVNSLTASYPILKDKITWLSPALNLGILTAVTYPLFNVLSSPMAKIAIQSVHVAAATLFGKCPPPLFFSLDEALCKSLDCTTYNVNQILIAEGLATTAFIVSSLALASLKVNPILANTASVCASSATHALALRVQQALTGINLPFSPATT